MGTNRRYAHSIDARMDERIAEGIMRTGAPDSLDPKQLNLDHEPLTRAPKPESARAWVRHGEHSIEIDVQVIAWTARAMAIRWRGPEGVEHHAWVWAGAVTQQNPRR